MIISMSECRRGGVSLAKDKFENKKIKKYFQKSVDF